MDMKALADRVIARNSPRNEDATTPNQACNSTRNSDLERELRNLVSRCGKCYGFSGNELHLATDLALSKPDEAITCYRSIASRIFK
jgi:methionyl-tRNA synthetase